MKTDAWRDRWIKKRPENKASCTGVQQPTPLLVANLIDSQRRCWRVEMVHEIFSTDDAEIIILQTPFRRVCKPNRLFWDDSITGEFIVKSAY